VSSCCTRLLCRCLRDAGECVWVGIGGRRAETTVDVDDDDVTSIDCDGNDALHLQL